MMDDSNIPYGPSIDNSNVSTTWICVPKYFYINIQQNLLYMKCRACDFPIVADNIFKQHVSTILFPLYEEKCKKYFRRWVNIRVRIWKYEKKTFSYLQRVHLCRHKTLNTCAL